MVSLLYEATLLNMQLASSFTHAHIFICVPGKMCVCVNKCNEMPRCSSLNFMPAVMCILANHLISLIFSFFVFQMTHFILFT